MKFSEYLIEYDYNNNIYGQTSNALRNTAGYLRRTKQDLQDQDQRDNYKTAAGVNAQQIAQQVAGREYKSVDNANYKSPGWHENQQKIRDRQARQTASVDSNLNDVLNLDYSKYPDPAKVKANSIKQWVNFFIDHKKDTHFANQKQKFIDFIKGARELGDFRKSALYNLSKGHKF